MKGVSFLAIMAFLALSLTLAGCGERCDRPYKLIDDVCCTDENQNNVCDVEELEEKEDDSFKMADAAYDDSSAIDIPDTVVKRPELKQPDEKVLYEAPAKELEKEAAEPVIDTSFNVKVADQPAAGMKEAVVTPDRDTRITFTVENIKYDDGHLYRADFEIKNNMDMEVSPRVLVYGLVDGESVKIADVLFKPLIPGGTRVREGEYIGAEYDKGDQKIKWELAYHSAKTGLVTVTSKETLLPKK